MPRRRIIPLIVAAALAAIACKPATRLAATPTPAPVNLPNDWMPGGPYTGRITCLFTDGNALFAGGWHTGVYRSADGRNWASFNDGMTGHLDVLALAGDGRTLYAGTMAGELFEHDNGAWRLARQFGPGRRGAIRALAMVGGALFVGAGDGVYLTHDGGQSWRQVWNGGEVVSFAAASFGRKRLFFGTAANGLGACDSDGAACGPVPSYPGGKSIVSLSADAAELFIAAEGDGVYATRDGRVFARLDLRPAPTYPLAVLADGERLAASIQGEGLRLVPRAGPPTGGLIRFPRPIISLAKFRQTLFFGSDGLGVFALEGETIRPANQGLLNFSEELVDRALRGGATRTPPTPSPPRTAPN